MTNKNKSTSKTTSKFRNASNRRYLKGLFFETTEADKSSVVYTLKDVDHLGYPSLYRLYMASNDVTEYSFATQHLDDWEHWKELTNCTWFKPYVKRWREERAVRDRSRNLAAMTDIADDTNNKSSFQALKYLLERPWDKETSVKRGRPTKDETEEIKLQKQQEKKLVDEAAKRILN